MVKRRSLKPEKWVQVLPLTAKRRVCLTYDPLRYGTLIRVGVEVSEIIFDDKKGIPQFVSNEYIKEIN